MAAVDVHCASFTFMNKQMHGYTEKDFPDWITVFGASPYQQLETICFPSSPEITNISPKRQNGNLNLDIFSEDKSTSNDSLSKRELAGLSGKQKFLRAFCRLKLGGILMSDFQLEEYLTVVLHRHTDNYKLRKKARLSFENEALFLHHQLGFFVIEIKDCYIDGKVKKRFSEAANKLQKRITQLKEVYRLITGVNCPVEFYGVICMPNATLNRKHDTFTVIGKNDIEGMNFKQQWLSIKAPKASQNFEQPPRESLSDDILAFVATIISYHATKNVRTQINHQKKVNENDFHSFSVPSLYQRATDLPTLAAIKTMGSASSFVVTADGSGAFVFDSEKISFAFINFQTEETSYLSFKGFEITDGDIRICSLFAADQFHSNTGEISCLLVGLVEEKKSLKVFCVLFSANNENKTVLIVDEVATNWFKRELPLPYICKTKSGKHFAVNYVPYKNYLSVGEISVTHSRKLEFKALINKWKIQNPSYWPSPFVEDDAVFYFINERKNEIMKIPFDGAPQQSTSFLPHRDCATSALFSTCIPFFYNDSIIYCSNDAQDETTVWSFSIQRTDSLTRMATIKHHRRNWGSMNNLEVLPDGTAFLLIQCDVDECGRVSHIYQFDLSMNIKYSVSQKELGKGGFGIVLAGTLNSQKVAVKILHEMKTVPDDRKRKILLAAVSEARKLKILEHRNIVKGYGFKIEENRFLLFMELMIESVKQKINNSSKKRLEEIEAFRILQQALEGLVYLHTFKPKPIVHRDIKCANILLDANGNAKLEDFHLAQPVKLNDAGSTNLALAPIEEVGTHYWQAPEVLEPTATYGRKADVWSIGCTIVEMLTGYPPHINLQPSKWAIGLYTGKLAYDPQKLVPGASRVVINILEKTFRRETDPQKCKNSQVRPHSWELLADVICENQLQTAKAAHERAEKKYEELQRRILELKCNTTDVLNVSLDAV